MHKAIYTHSRNLPETNLFESHRSMKPPGGTKKGWKRPCKFEGYHRLSMVISDYVGKSSPSNPTQKSWCQLNIQYVLKVWCHFFSCLFLKAHVLKNGLKIPRACCVKWTPAKWSDVRDFPVGSQPIPGQKSWISSSHWLTEQKTRWKDQFQISMIEINLGKL